MKWADICFLNTQLIVIKITNFYRTEEKFNENQKADII